MRDLKEALGSARKADITHVRGGIKRYIARACSYGSAKYERANFLRPAAPGAAPDAQVAADFERLRAYLRAAASHVDATLDAMEMHLAMDPQLADADGMRRAAYAEDTDAKPGCPVGASGLPHLAHAAASLMMAIEQATVYGLLPADPGEPWAERAKAAPIPYGVTPAGEILLRGKAWAAMESTPEFSRDMAALTAFAPVPDLDDERHPASGPHTTPTPAPRPLPVLAAEVAEEFCPHLDEPHDGPGPCVDCFMAAAESPRPGGCDAWGHDPACGGKCGMVNY